MTTIASNQSFPSSILGIPFSESPEMMSQEIVVTSLSLSSQGTSRQASASVLPSQDALSTRSPESVTDSPPPDLLLTSTFSKEREVVGEEAGATLLDVSIVPPITISASGSAGVDSLSIQKIVQRPLYGHARDTAAEESNRSSAKLPVSMSDPVATGIGATDDSRPSLPNTHRRPPNAIDSIFQLGLGQGRPLAIFASTRSHVAQEDEPTGKSYIRFHRERPPTPYPTSFADAEGGSIFSDHAIPTTDDPHPFPVILLTPSSPHKTTHCDDRIRDENDRGLMSVEEIVDVTEMASPTLPSPRQTVSPCLTLNGYPLIKSPSTMALEGGDNSTVDGKGRIEASFGRSKKNLALPPMLPLSRTPTILQSDRDYGPSFRLAESDEEDENDDAYDSTDKNMDHNGGAIGSAVAMPFAGNDDDDSREGMEARSDDAYHLHLLSMSNSRLQSLCPTPTPTPSPDAPGTEIGLFRLPNREISASAVVALATATPPSAKALPETEGQAQNQQTEPPSQQEQPLQQLQLQPREDPIEHLLRMSRQQLGKSVDMDVDPVQKYFQHTRTVASWAQEQARIQEKRIKRRARARALKELRKQDPSATLSVHSSDDDNNNSSSLSSNLSTSYSYSPSSSVSSSLPQSLPTPSSIISSGRMARDRQPGSRKKSLGMGIGFGIGVGVGVGGDSGNNNQALPSLKEDEPMEMMSRLELMVQEEEAEEEEPGLYMDTDDVQSPSVEVESLGAGVGQG
ncbi:hypothetical protein BGX28_000595 [Mortierella sp. GBA30]|nr:hypothetical protein BGX28_000595 [Mortierella sp. GBA30]